MAFWINCMDPKQTDANCSGMLLFHCAKEGNIDALAEYLSSGGPLASDTVGSNGLHWATICNKLEACRLLKRSGVSVDSKTKLDRTPLHLAAFYGHERIAEMLLEANCELDPIDFLQMTPLHWAVEKKHPNIVRMLLQRGANKNAVSKFNKTPRSIAEQSDDAEIVQLFGMSLVEVKKEKGLVKTEILQEGEEEEEEEEEEEAELTEQDYEEHGEVDEELETMSIFDETDEVEVIPVDEDISQSPQKGDQLEEESPVKGEEEHARDESFSNLHETMNKLGSIRGLKPGDATTLKILQNIGISMSEEPDPTIITNVLQSGRKIVLSEAGKYILNQTKKNDEDPLALPANHHHHQNVPMDSSNKRPPRSRMIKESPSMLVKRQKVSDVDRTLIKSEVQTLRDKETRLDDMDGICVDWSEQDDVLPLERVQKMEKQIQSLQRDKQLLRNSLDLALKHIEENRKRIERLEAVVNRKED